MTGHLVKLNVSSWAKKRRRIGLPQRESVLTALDSPTAVVDLFMKAHIQRRDEFPNVYVLSDAPLNDQESARKLLEEHDRLNSILANTSMDRYIVYRDQVVLGRVTEIDKTRNSRDVLLCRSMLDAELSKKSSHEIEVIALHFLFTSSLSRGVA